jgi:hypothetical protein
MTTAMKNVRYGDHDTSRPIVLVEWDRQSQEAVYGYRDELDSDPRTYILQVRPFGGALPARWQTDDSE